MWPDLHATRSRDLERHVEQDSRCGGRAGAGELDPSHSFRIAKRSALFGPLGGTGTLVPEKQFSSLTSFREKNQLCSVAMGGWRSPTAASMHCGPSFIREAPELRRRVGPARRSAAQIQLGPVTGPMQLHALRQAGNGSFRPLPRSAGDSSESPSPAKERRLPWRGAGRRRYHAPDPQSRAGS